MYLFMRVLNYTYNLGVYMYKSYRNLKVYNSYIYIYMYVYVHIYIYIYIFLFLSMFVRVCGAFLMSSYY